MENQNLKKGVSIYFALIIMFILLAISLGISLIIISQAKMIREMGDSVTAFYAADTGIENSLYNSRQKGEIGGIPGPILIGDANYTVTKVIGEEKWRSVGTFKQVKRAIEIRLPTLPPELITWTEDCNDPVQGGQCGGGTQCVVDGTQDCTNTYFCTPHDPLCPDTVDDRPNTILTNQTCVSNQTSAPCGCHGTGTPGEWFCRPETNFPLCYSTGGCTYECKPGYYNCDNNRGTGCESSSFPCP